MPLIIRQLLTLLAFALPLYAQGSGLVLSPQQPIQIALPPSGGGGGSAPFTASLISPVMAAISTNTSALSLGVLGAYYNGGDFSGGSSQVNRGSYVYYLPGMLAVGFCNGGTVAQNAPTDPSGNNTWTNDLSFVNSYATYMWHSVIASNGGGQYGAPFFPPSAGWTCNLQGATNQYMIGDVSGFFSATGWPASPKDTTGTAHTTTNSITVTAGAPNSQAVELEIARCGTGTASEFPASAPSGWTLMNIDHSGFVEDWYRISTVIETASFSLTFTGALSADCVLGTFKHN